MPAPIYLESLTIYVENPLHPHSDVHGKAYM